MHVPTLFINSFYAIQEAMNALRRAIILVLLSAMSLQGFAQLNIIPRSTPAQEGVDAQAVVRFYNALLSLNKTEIHHVVVMRHGKVISELHPAPFRAQDSHTLYSESKTFCCMAVGLCVDDNRLRVTDRVASFFPELLPDTISDNLAQMTVHDLLTMSSGIIPDWNMRSITSEWEKTWLGKQVVKKPGEAFLYDSMSTYMLSAIVKKVTGLTVLQLLNQRIFSPLGIEQAEWEESPSGINTGGWGLRMQAESQAKFGQLLLQNGLWNGRQLISREWMGLVTRVHKVPFADNPDKHRQNPGYGYQVWHCERPGSYCADGALGQYIFIIPDKDMVVVINSASLNTSPEIDTVNKYLIAGVTDDATTDNGQKTLDQLVATASQHVVTGIKAKKTIKPTIALHDGFALEFDNYNTLRYTYDGRTITACRDKWNYNEDSQQPPYSINPKSVFSGLKQQFTTAARFTWESPRKLVINTYWVDFISGETVTIEFDRASKKAHVIIKRNYTDDTIADTVVDYTL